MKSLAQIRRNAHHHIDNVNQLEELMPWLQCIPLHAIKETIKAHIQSDDKVRETYYRSMPMTAVLPDDICREILFCADNNQQAIVSKQFNELSSMNQEKVLKHRYSEHPVMQCSIPWYWYFQR